MLGPDEISRALTRVAHEILERTNGAADVVLLGIPTRGVPLAQPAGRAADPGRGPSCPAGSLDITMYRDDLRLRPARPLGHTAVPASGIDGKIVVLVDDVLYSGRTVRAALDALGDLGRPRAVQLAVLVDRGHRELPIRADYVGQEPADLAAGGRPGAADRDRRPGRGGARRGGSGRAAGGRSGGGR